MPDNTITMPGSIGASSPGLAEKILNAEAEIAKIGLELQGYHICLVKGTLEYTLVTKNADELKQIAHTTLCTAWFQGELRALFSKNTYLSKVNSDVEMYQMMWSTAHSFLDELFMRRREFELSDKKFAQLCRLYAGYLDFAYRQPLGGGIRNFLNTSTSESFTRNESKISEEQQKGGILSGLMGRKPAQ